MGPPPFISSPSKLCPTRAQHITLGHSFLYLYTSPQLIIIYCTNAFIFNRYITFLSSPLGDLLPFFGNRNPCHPWLEHYLSSTLTGIFHIFRVPHKPLTSAIWICSPCPASGTTYPRSCRPPNTRPRWTVEATFYLTHTPTKGSLESSHILTSSMYLLPFLTSPSIFHEAIFFWESRPPFLSTSTQFSRRATVSWFSLSTQWEISNDTGWNTIAPCCRWPP